MTVLADTRATHLVNAPLASIDLPEWLFSLSDTSLPGMFASPHCRGHEPH